MYQTHLSSSRQHRRSRRAVRRRAPTPSYLAGGHTLLPAMKQRLAAPSDVDRSRRIKDLVGVAASGDTVTIGAATTLLRRHDQCRC